MSEGYIVLSAHHCAPFEGSEHAVGWNAINEISKNNKVIVITENNLYREAISKEIAKLNSSGRCIKVYFVDHGSVSDGRKNNLRMGYYLTYILYQIRVYFLVKKISANFNISLIHHITIVGFREPGFLWILPYPFIWGPVGGLVYTPKKLFSELSTKMKIFQFIRNSITNLQFSLSLRVRKAYKKTKDNGAFIAAEPSIGKKFSRKFGGDFLWIPETGCSIGQELPEAKEKFNSNKLKLLWVGALIDIKPMRLILDGIANSNYKDSIELLVIGDGDSKSSFESYARKLEINVNFIGWVEHEKVRDYYVDSDLFCLFSMKDLTTNVVFEALSSKTPVICLDHHGYSYIIDDSCGIKIGINKRDTIVSDISIAMNEIFEGKIDLRVLSVGAFERASNFTWEKNMSRFSTIYSEVLNENT
ncbi:glycosyltransferase [Vibrio breoganii]